MPTHPIAITGMHRSGTSMITRGLHESGLHLIGGEADALLAAADDNPEGFWENKAIVSCNDDLLEAAGGAWDNPPDLLPQAVDDPRFAEIVEPATTALAGLRENDRWGFKDPRLCLTAAFWLDLQPDLRFVICVRNPLEVALSLKRRNQNSYSLGLALWERYYGAILDLVPEDRRIITHYDSYFLDPAGELGRVCDFAALDPAQLDVRSDLRHHDVGVSLDEASVSAGIRDLYRQLCDEAGAPQPRPSVADEGQVRRLVLDGTVAIRHAEQRQAAIDRLEERLDAARTVEKELREELAQVRRESERRRVDLDHTTREFATYRSDTKDRLDEIFRRQAETEDQNRRLIDTGDTIADMTKRLEDGQRHTHDRLAHNEAIVAAVQTKLRAVEDEVGGGVISSIRGSVRRALGIGRNRVAKPSKRVAAAGARRGLPLAKRGAKASARRLPTPVRHNIRRAQRAAASGQAAQRVEERAEIVVRRLPAPAQKVARRGTAAMKKAGIVPKATRVAKGVNRRLPAPAKRVLRKALPSAPAAKRPNRPVKKASPTPRPKSTADGRATEIPKGPASFKWQKGYERLVAECIEPTTRWAVVTPGSKAAVHDVAGRTATPFPCPAGAAPAADSLSLIAALEALRVQGIQRLVVPEGSRPWFAAHPELRDHLMRHHDVVEDRSVAGIVIDLTASPSEGRRSLLAEVNELAADLASQPAVLNWSDIDITGELPGFTTFAPADPSSLPYFDDSVEVVVVSSGRALDEARRVASVGVVVIDPEGSGLRVASVEAIASAEGSADRVVVYAQSADDELIDAAVAARVAEAGAELVVDGDPTEASGDIVVVLERGVVPLPGSIAVLAAAAQADAVTVAKVLDPHGRVESAGGMIFADSSGAGIAAGTFEVRAPWHEYVRPAAWGAGMLAARSELVADLDLAAGDGLAEWCLRAWSGGAQVTYRPRAGVVRVEGSAPTASMSEEWAPMLAGRPQRPAELSDGAWRYLIANDDPSSLSNGAR